jgi:O-antigen/teichoic acid export membrane protein
VPGPFILLERLRQSPFLRSVSGVFGAGLVNNGVSFLMTIIAARVLGPQEFAVLGIMLAVMMFGSTVLDFGVSVSLVRLFHASEVPRKQLVTVVLGWKIVVSVLAVVLAVPVAPLGKSAFFGHLPVTDGEFIWAVGGAGLLSLWTTVRAVYQAREEFTALVTSTYWYAGLRFAAIAGAMIFSLKSASVFVIAIYILPLLLILPVAAGQQVFRASRGNDEGAVGWSPRDAGGTLRRILGYGRWVALSAVSYALLWRLPQFALSHRATETEVSYYSLGITFIAFFSLMNDSMRMVLLPRVAGMQSPAQRSEFRASMRRWAFPYFVGMGVLVVVLWAVQILALGDEYRPGIPVFLLLSAGTIATLYGGLINSLVHSHGIPQLDAGMNCVKVAALALGLWLVPPSSVPVAALFAAIVAIGEWSLVLIVRTREAAGHAA